MSIADESPVLAAPLSVLRAPQWAHFVVLPLTPFTLRELVTRAGALRALLGVAIAAGALGYAYAVNAVGDRASDAQRSKNPLVGFERPPTSVAIVTAGAALSSLMASMLLGPTAVACAVASLVAGTIYSVGPRAKAYPVVGLVMNTLIFVPLLFPCGVVARADMFVLVTTFVGLLVQNQLVHEVADADEDALGHDMTTARAFGLRGVRVAVVLTALVSAALVAPRAGLVGSSVAAATLVVGAATVIFVGDAHRARRIHRHVSALGGAALYVLGSFVA